MHTVTKKLASVFLSVLLLLLVIPVGLFAQAESTVTEYAATLGDDGYVSFVTDHFSIYTLTAIPGSPATGETRHTGLWLALALGSAVVLIVLTVLNKKDRS